MHCTSCDTRLPDGAIFCTSCGQRTAAAAPAPTPATYAPAPAVASPAAPMAYAPAPAAYAPAAYGPAPARSSAAVVSLAFGLLSWCMLPLFGALIAVAAGHSARRQIAASRGAVSGSGMANAGLVLGYLNLAAASAVGMLVAAVAGMGFLAWLLR